MNKEELSYSKAVEEMETIMDRIESGTLDLDELSGQVARVSELLEFCKQRLYQTREKVEEILREDQEDEKQAE